MTSPWLSFHVCGISTVLSYLQYCIVAVLTLQCLSSVGVNPKVYNPSPLTSTTIVKYIYFTALFLVRHFHTPGGPLFRAFRGKKFLMFEKRFRRGCTFCPSKEFVSVSMLTQMICLNTTRFSTYLSIRLLSPLLDIRCFV